MIKPELHGMIKTSEYNSWTCMKQRCYNKKHMAYSQYGGRGITVCDKWRNSFLAFYRDMGDKPSSRHSLDRIDNNGNYEPSNCKWSTYEEQQHNTRTYKTNTSGRRGVSWNKREKVWCARIFPNHGSVYLGGFTKFEDAVKAREEGERKYFGKVMV